VYDHDCAADHFQYFHDLCLVWAPEVLASAAVQSHSGELVDCVCRVLLSGAGERIGSYEFSAVQLKTIQEVITLVVFSGFSVWYLGDELKWNYFVGFGLMVMAVGFIFKKWSGGLVGSIGGPFGGVGRGVTDRMGCFLNRNLCRAIFRLR
jgi:uncharacterized protein (DUF486 family)